MVAATKMEIIFQYVSVSNPQVWQFTLRQFTTSIISQWSRKISVIKIVMSLKWFAKKILGEHQGQGSTAQTPVGRPEGRGWRAVLAHQERKPPSQSPLRASCGVMDPKCYLKFWSVLFKMMYWDRECVEDNGWHGQRLVWWVTAFLGCNSSELKEKSLFLTLPICLQSSCSGLNETEVTVYGRWEIIDSNTSQTNKCSGSTRSYVKHVLYFTLIFACSFKRYLLVSCYVPRVVLLSKNIDVNKTDKNFHPYWTYANMRRQMTSKINEKKYTICSSNRCVLRVPSAQVRPVDRAVSTEDEVLTW